MFIALSKDERQTRKTAFLAWQQRLITSVAMRRKKKVTIHLQFLFCTIRQSEKFTFSIALHFVAKTKNQKTWKSVDRVCFVLFWFIIRLIPCVTFQEGIAVSVVCRTVLRCNYKWIHTVLKWQLFVPPV